MGDARRCAHSFAGGEASSKILELLERERSRKDKRGCVRYGCIRSIGRSLVELGIGLGYRR
ncbi:MAG: hypothetical protein QW613_07660, partial [Thermoprotei archaeon]